MIRESRVAVSVHLPVLLSAAASLMPAFAAGAEATFNDGRCRFVPSEPIPVGTVPFSAAIGDLDSDGRPDIVVANEGSNNVSVLMGLGGGTFAAATPFSVGAAPRSVAIADLGGDDKLDLIVADSGSGTVTMRFGTGTGSFGPAVTLSAGAGPQAVAVADLNADGNPDVVSANGGGGSVSVLLGTGGGAFAAALSYAAGGNPSSVAVDDYNDDAKPDLAVTNESAATVSILLGDGAGAFGAPTPFNVGSQPRSVVSGHFNADQFPDLAVANWQSATVSILIGGADGTFAGAVDYPASALPTSLALADFGDDGMTELVVANETSFPNILTILQGLEAGTFGTPDAVPVGGIRPRGTAAGDLNADGVPDVVVANYTTGDITVQLGACEPKPQVSQIVGIDRTSSYELRKSPVWFDRSVPYAYTHVVTHADLDRDGRTDLVRASIVPEWEPLPIQVLRNEGGNVFTDHTDAALTAPGPGVIYARKGLNGDYNSDGWPDVLIVATGPDAPPFPGEPNQLFLSNGDGTLHYSPALEFFGAGYHHGGASGDVDGNGTIDVVAFPASGASNPYLLINDGAGNFTRSTYRLPREIPGMIYTAELLDIDLDGYIDLICGGHEFGGTTPTSIYWGSSSGLYRDSARTTIPTLAGFGGVLDFAAEDLDGDGDRDLIVNRFPDFFAFNGRYFQILRQEGPRQFIDETAARMTMKADQPGIDYIRTQDINGDGSVDIFVDNRALATDGDYAWTNNGHGVFEPYFGAVNPSMSFFHDGFE